MHTVVETNAFRRAASDSGMSDAEVASVVDHVAADPESGDEIPGTGGCRKIRFAGRGKGKSGGYRVITFFSGPAIPVFLLTVFSKGERSDLAQSERNALRIATKQLVATYGARAKH
jgi:hypothetical protein